MRNATNPILSHPAIARDAKARWVVARLLQSGWVVYNPQSENFWLGHAINPPPDTSFVIMMFPQFAGGIYQAYFQHNHIHISGLFDLSKVSEYAKLALFVTFCRDSADLIRALHR